MESVSIKENKSSIQNRYRSEIDGLRAFAVVAVIINHFNKAILPNGYLGVDIFFVISGFVITSSLYQKPSKNFKDFISGFYERRIKRLVPALSVFVLIMSIAICLFTPTIGFSLKTGLTSLFGLSNLYLLKESTDYFAQSTQLNVFTHTWSLGVEEQFYILFPFLIWFSGFGRRTKNGARNLFLTIGALAIASLISFLYFYPINQSAAYYLMQTRFWEIATGCLLFITFQKRASIEKFLEKVPPLLVLAMIIGVMFLPMAWAVVSTVTVVALSAILIASLKKQTVAFKIFTHPKIVYTGLISYSLYLWHWGVLSISRWTIGIHWWSIPLQVALMWGLAIASYLYIETPLRQGNWFGKRWKTIVVGGGMIVTLSGFLIALGKPLKGILYTGKSSIKQIYIPNLKDQIRLDKSSVNGLTGKDCHAEKAYSSEKLRLLFNECKYPLIRQSNNQSTIAFLGDSHARFLHLEKSSEILTNSGFRVIHYSHDGCPFPLPPHGINPPECNKFLINAENKIFQDLQQGDSIVIYNYHLSHLGSKNLKDTRHNILNRYNFIVSDSPTKIDLYMNGLNQLSKKAEKKSISIYLIGSTYRNNDLMLSKEWFRPYPIAERTLLEEASIAKKLNKELSKQIKDRSMKNVTFIDPLEILDKSCVRDVTSFLECFIDSDHLSDKSSKDIIDFLMKNYFKDRSI